MPQPQRTQAQNDPPGYVDIPEPPDTPFTIGVKPPQDINIPEGYESIDPPDYKPPEPALTVDNVIRALRPIIAGGTAAGAATIGGPIAAPPAYLTMDMLLKNTQSKPPGFGAEELKDSAKAALWNEIGGYITRYAGRAIQAIPTLTKYRKGMGELAETVTGRTLPEAQQPLTLGRSLREGAEELQNVTTPIQSGGRFVSSEELLSRDALQKLIQREGQGSPLVTRLRQIIDDPGKIRDVLEAGNVKIPGLGPVMSNNARADLAGVALQDLLEKGPSKALELINSKFKKESYDLLFSQQSMSRLQQLLRAGQTAEIAEKISRWPRRLLLSAGGVHIAGELISGHMSAWGQGEVVVGAILGGRALVKALANPKLMRGLTNLAEGIPAGMSDQAISRMLVGSLQGTGNVLQVQLQDGRTIPATVEEGGRLVPVPQQ